MRGGDIFPETGGGGLNPGEAVAALRDYLRKRTLALSQFLRGDPFNGPADSVFFGSVG